MRKSGHRFSGAIKFTQIASTYLRHPALIIESDHDDFGPIQSKIIVIYWFQYHRGLDKLMETRARYILMGLFLLVAIGAGFAFVYWLQNSSGFSERAHYRIQFPGSVAGLRTGAAVLFNGMRVGEVSALDLDTHSTSVLATIAVMPATPIRADTQIAIETQGLMGGTSVALRAQDPAAPLLAAPLLDGIKHVPLLVAKPDAGQDTMQVARDVLKRIDQVVAENSEPLHGTIESLKTFSAALARNSDRVDGILIGLERMTGGASGTPTPVIYDLAAPRNFPKLETKRKAQLVVPEPTAVLALDTQRVLQRLETSELASIANAQWSDTLTKLFQAKIIQSFENADALGSVLRPMDVLTPNYQLLIDIRRFSIGPVAEGLGQLAAEVEFMAKLLDEKGHVVGAQSFQASVPVQASSGQALTGSAATAGLAEAFGKAAAALVAWSVKLV
jgi:phospholipid/cholesterol/gamma-HCH transport system substrate-binding protein